MNQKKLLILLICLVLFVNYLNYWQPDRKELSEKVALLQSKVDREQRMDNLKVTKKDLELPQLRFFFDGTKMGYSQAMGTLQKMMQQAAKESACKIDRLKWAQVPVSGKEYQKLKISFSLNCAPAKFFDFVRQLHQGGKLLRFQDLRVSPDHKIKNTLSIGGQIVGYRLQHAF